MFICLLINLFVSCPISESTLKLPILMLVPTDGRRDGRTDRRTDWRTDGHMDGRTVGRTDWHEIQKQDFFSMFRDLQFGPQFKFRLMLRFDRVVYFDINCFKLRPWSELSICKSVYETNLTPSLSLPLPSLQK